MQTIAEFRAKIQSLISELPSEAEKVTIAMAQSGLSIVKNRSINQGIFKDGEDGNYTDYSTNPVKTSKFKGKELNQKGRDFVKKNRLGTWHDFRKSQGLQSEKVNLAYSNRMWTSIAITKVAYTPTGVAVEITTTDGQVQTYIGQLAERYGNFLHPTEQEEKDLLADAFNDLRLFVEQKLT